MKTQSRITAIRLMFALMAALTFASFGATHFAGAEDNNPNPQPTFKEKCDAKGGTVSTKQDGNTTWSFCKGTTDGNDFKCDTTTSTSGQKCQYTRTIPTGGRLDHIRVDTGTVVVVATDPEPELTPTVIRGSRIGTVDGSILSPLP